MPSSEESGLKDSENVVVVTTPQKTSTYVERLRAKQLEMDEIAEDVLVPAEESAWKL